MEKVGIHNLIRILNICDFSHSGFQGLGLDRKMPRSNKKKNILKPPPKHPTSQSIVQHDKVILDLLSDERNMMISRAITSARYHGQKEKIQRKLTQIK